MAAVNKVTLGLKKIEIGDIASDGDMGSTLTQMGYTLLDSCSFTSEDATTVEHNVEELDDVFESMSTPGKKTLVFSIADPSLDTLKALLGGTVNTSDGTWEPDNTAPTIEKSIRVTPKKGLVFDFPRTRIDAKWNAQFGKNNLAVLEVTATLLIPTKAGVGIYKTTEIPTV
ncbi:MAG: hypothetical protein LBL13_07005 [Bacteroidales bacterium]|jgi:hypothetical protein|nr:hypothetical protein [Bacteroidales bacterium]